LLRIYTLIITLSFLFTSNAIQANEYGHDDFISDWASPINDKESRATIIYGTVLTSTLVAFRNDIVEPFQESMSSQNLLGDDLSHYGDLAGQLIPNLIYMGYMSYDGHYNKQLESTRRAKLMFKVSAFSGLTTFFLKRIFNQRRPNKGDRNSFPSGHTTTAFAFASVIAKEHPGWKYAAYGLASLVGFSRINDNAHYLHDVVMGATIGSSFGYALYNKSQKQAGKETNLDVSVSPLVGGQYVGVNYKFN
jgi:hypothetical protein